MKTPKRIQVYFDTQDPKNNGWAYRCFSGDHEDSGPLGARRLNASDKLLTRLARAACSVSHTRTPVTIRR